MCRLGLSSFLCEAAIATMMFSGNYVFIRYLGEDGVAAFSIACYFFPIIFMINNAIGQSAQPILSYNFGAGDLGRVRQAFHLALATAVAVGAAIFAVTLLFSRGIVSMFIESGYPAFEIAVEGLPLFASGFVFFAVNIVSINYFQSVERPRPAMALTLLRGFVFLVGCFFRTAASGRGSGNLVGRAALRACSPSGSSSPSTPSPGGGVCDVGWDAGLPGPTPEIENTAVICRCTHLFRIFVRRNELVVQWPLFSKKFSRKYSLPETSCERLLRPYGAPCLPQGRVCSPGG